MDLDRLKKEIKIAYQWAKENLIGKKIFHQEIGKEVLFTHGTIKKNNLD